MYIVYLILLSLYHKPIITQGTQPEKTYWWLFFKRKDIMC